MITGLPLNDAKVDSQRRWLICPFSETQMRSNTECKKSTRGEHCLGYNLL